MSVSARRADRICKRVQLANGAERIEQLDFLGRLQQVDEPDGSFLRYRYDGDGELAHLLHSSGESVRFTRKPDVWVARTERVTTEIHFDTNGFPHEVVYQIDGNEWRIGYRRDARGCVLAMRYPGTAAWLRVGNELRCEAQCYARIAPPRIEFANGAVGEEAWESGAEDACQVSEKLVSDATAQSGKENVSPRLRRITHLDRNGIAVVDQDYAYDARGRVSRAGNQTFGYDELGHLTSCDGTHYAFDAQARQIRAGNEVFSYADAPHVMCAGGVRFAYDALGRRSARMHGTHVQRYAYNLFGQLAEVACEDGTRVRYLYDGFGRLVGRDDGREVLYFIVDFDGHRIADCRPDGSVLRSYLWFGASCVGAIDGVCGGPLAHSFHRVHGGTLAAIGDGHGVLTSVVHRDPYGTDAPIVDGIPGYACLFGDRVTGLLHAGSRWLDPAIGQFISADSWFGTHALDRMPRGARRIFDAMPGGTGRAPGTQPDGVSRPARHNSPVGEESSAMSAQTAYDWCNRDPVNYCDPNGHNVFGLIFSTISAFLWSMQVTSVALQMELISLVIFILISLPALISDSVANLWHRINPFNGLPPLLASARLNVPFAFPLNSIWNAGGQVFTMGNVIWVNGDQEGGLGTTSQRDLLECSNANTYRAATDEVAADVFRFRNPNALATATADANGAHLNALAITAPAGSAANVIFKNGDQLSIRLSGVATGDEIRTVSVLAANVITLDTALPAALFNQAVDVARLDGVSVHMQKDDANAARTVTFLRGKALHFGNQVAAAMPADGLTVTEYMRAGVHAETTADSPPEAALIRLGDKADLALFAANDFIRVRAGADFSARQVARLRGIKDLILDTALATPVPTTKYRQIEVAKMTADAAAIAAQTAAGTRVNVGNIADLRKGDGVAVDNTGGAPVTTARRIVTQVLLGCPVAALPAALLNVPITVDIMTPDASKQASGKTSSANDIDTAKDEVGRFANDQPVRVRKAPGTDFFTVLANVDKANNKLTLVDALPAADFPAGTDVAVNLLTNTKNFTAEQSAGAEVILTVDRPDSPALNDVLRVRLTSTTQGAVVRQVTTAPIVIADVDTAFPATHAANLSVQRFVPDANATKGNASAPLVQLRFTIQGGANPYVKDDELLFSQGEQGYGKIFLAPVGQVIEIDNPLDFTLGSANISVQRVSPTGANTPDGKLAESLILIPSDPDEDLITRRRAVESHEMRHVWQYAVLGPFFFSMPIPWLINLGFSAFGSESTGNSANKIMRHIGVGGIDSLFALVAWGVGSLFGKTSPGANLVGTVDAGLKTIQFATDVDAGKLKTFTEGSPCEAAKGDYATFNIVEHLDEAQKKLTLRFALETDKFAVSDQVTVSVSPFEKIRSTVNKWFSLDLERLWSDHIPVSWGRVLSKFLNRDGWIPGLGLYFLDLMKSGGDQSRIHFEQDASYHSGDVYTNFATSDPAEIFVGQFSRVIGFRGGRGFGDTATGISDINPLEFLTIETPTGIGALQPTDLVFGTVNSVRANPTAPAFQQVRFRQSHIMHLSDKVENAVGGFFAAAQPGTYVLHVPGELTDSLVTTVTFDADFLKLRNIKVKALGVKPDGTATDPLFETETLLIKIEGDINATYALAYQGAAPAPPIAFDAANSLLVTVPVNGTGVHNLAISATYKDTDTIFHGAGQLDPINLTAAQLTNLCQVQAVNVQALVAPVIADVQAGQKQTFQVPIAPAGATVTSPLPAGATINASVINGVGRPATLTFIAPDAVNAQSPVTFDLVFGFGANAKTVPVTVQVTPKV